MVSHKRYTEHYDLAWCLQSVVHHNDVVSEPKMKLTMVNHELLWSTMNYHNRLQSTLVKNHLAILQNKVKNHEHSSSWSTMVVHGPCFVKWHHGLTMVRFHLGHKGG